MAKCMGGDTQSPFVVRRLVKECFTLAWLPVIELRNPPAGVDEVRAERGTFMTCVCSGRCRRAHARAQTARLLECRGGEGEDNLLVN